MSFVKCTVQVQTKFTLQSRNKAHLVLQEYRSIDILTTVALLERLCVTVWQTKIISVRLLVVSFQQFIIKNE